MWEHGDVFVMWATRTASPALPWSGGRRGFSMIEMLVIVVIIGVSLGMALPRVQRLSTVSRVSNAQSVVAGDIRRVAGLAAQRRRPMVMRWDSASSRMVARQLGSSGALLQRALGAQSEYRLSVVVSPDSAIILPSGLASTFCVRLQGGYAPDTVVRRVQLNTSGQARLLAPGGACI